MCSTTQPAGRTCLGKVAGWKDRPTCDIGADLFARDQQSPRMTISIRRMKLEDVPAVHAIDVLSFTLPWSERSYRFELVDNPASRGWVAEKDGKIVAMLVLWFIIDEAHIATVAVHPEYRRMGLGEQVLLEALRSVRSEGAVRAFLEVRTGNIAAQAMYKKYGFGVMGVRPGYYKDNNEDALLMNLEELDNLEVP